MAAESSQRANLSSRSGWKYDVFLSFRGETRLGFTDHLHSALKSKGLIVFRDEEKLERGENIRPSLWKAIQESEYKVIVISKDYASSTWCLDELIEIVKCKGEKVLPIFYDVDPSHVRKQMGSFATAFAEHTTKKADEGQMRLWRDALKKVCDLAGWDVRDRHESEVVKKICSKIFYGLSRPLLDIEDDLVGIESQIKELMTLLKIREEDVCIRDEDARFLGIWGMGGVGKTTLAEVIYNRVSHRFDGRCFISSVREKSGDLFSLQKQLISQILGEEESLICKKINTILEGRRTIASMFGNKKVFIVLDDVDRENQLEALVGKTDWFGKGSRILVTSRDSQLLKRHVNENGIYEIKGLSYNDALQFFLLKAFNKPCHERSYVKLAKDIVKYAEGLPLALKVFGSSLFDSTIEAWECALDRLKQNPNSTILDRLQISYYGLENPQQKLFLDLACFYKGESLGCITHKLKVLGHFPQFDIPILEKKSLIRISNFGTIEMHDLLKEMGQQLVYHETKEPGERSRLWNHEDIIKVLNNDTGTNAVEAIILKLPLPKPMKLNFEGFSKMKRLKMLVIHPIKDYKGNDEILKNLSTIKWYGDLSKFMVSNELRILEWWGYPLECLPTNFEPSNLVEFKMPMSKIIKLWDATKNFEKLKYINLKDCKNLVEMPNLGGTPDIEELDITGTAVSQLSSIVPMEKLRVLRAGGGFSRPVKFSLHDLPLGLRLLTKLELSYCNLSDGAFLKDISLSSLEMLDLSGNNFTQMASISGLAELKCLDLNKCTRLKSLPPKLPLNLGCIGLRNCPSLTPFSDPRDLCTSSEMLVASDIPVNAHYFGSDGKRDGARHVGQPFGDEECDIGYMQTVEARILWGPALTSDIPEWFSPDVRGTFRFDFDVHVQLLAERSSEYNYERFDVPGMVLNLELVETNFYDKTPDDYIYSCWGYALFIVYEVVEINSRQRNCSSATFPVFVCELEVNNEDNEKVPEKCRGTSKVPLAFRVPENPSPGRNGIWVFLDYGCFASIVRHKEWYYIGSCSITISSRSPNVEVKDCGGRLVLKHDRSEFYKIIRSISRHGSEGFDVCRHICPCSVPSNFMWCGPIKAEWTVGSRKIKWTTGVRECYKDRERLQRKRQARKAEGSVEICEYREEEGVKIFEGSEEESEEEGVEICEEIEEEREEEEGVEISEESEGEEGVEICKEIEEEMQEEEGVEISEESKEEREVEEGVEIYEEIEEEREEEEGEQKGVEICKKEKRKELKSVKKGKRKEGLKSALFLISASVFLFYRFVIKRKR